MVSTLKERGKWDNAAQHRTSGRGRTKPEVIIGMPRAKEKVKAQRNVKKKKSP